MLTSRQPIWIGWGDELTYLYNDAYHSIIGGKHPWALGRPTREVWREIWSDIGPLLDTAMGGVEGTYSESQLLIMERNGYPEETYYTFSYSPVPGDDGSAGGIICANSDDTQRVIGERQLALLRELAAGAVNTRSWREAAERGLAALGSNPRDLPFALLYLRDPDSDVVNLAGLTGLTRDHEAAAASLRLAEAGPWPAAEALRRTEVLYVDNLKGRFSEALPTGGWETAARRAAVLPLRANGETGRSGVLIVGLNPYRLLDDGYEGFLKLATRQIASAIASADAYEQERLRAEALAELDRAKTAFFSNVSHEFRTPLTLMLGPLEDILSGQVASDQMLAHIEMAHRNGARLLRLVNSLLDFSRIEAGRVKAVYEPTDLSAYSREIASTFRSTIERAGMTLVVDCAALPRPAYIDREMWEKILLNLLSNAFKFTLEGMIAVSVRASEAGDTAVVTVSDTGVGVPAAELPRLFDRFHRIEGQKSRSMEGSGIGLALVQELVKLHGGDIAAESEPGVGTSFIIRLPLGRAHLPAGQIREGAATGAAAGTRAHEFVEEALRWIDGPPMGPASVIDQISTRAGSAGERKQRIVLADDNADMRDYVQRLLAGRWEVEAVSDGAAALEAIHARRPDLVLSDVMMPGLDGFGLLRAIRQDEALRELPVILLSARAGEEARIEGLEAGADDYMVKPFSARELLARLGSNLELARIRREAKAAIARSEDALRELNAGLEERVAREIAERSRAEEALRQAQKMEAVGQLTGGVAHDFNNLLTLIIGGLDTIRRSKPDEDGRRARALDMALRGAESAAALTRRLLAFSRRQPLDPKPLELNLLVREMTDLLHRTLGEQVELEGVLSPRLWSIEADQHQLENAILNLAVNARDAMPDGGKLTLETTNIILDERYVAVDAEVIPGEYVELAVSDTGAGMSRETLERVFEPFFTTKEVGRGTGLGLSMVYGFVKQSGGHITIYSEPGLGTTVKLYFPRREGEAEPAKERIAEPAPLAGRGEIILVVEDNANVRAYSLMILRELGYEVIEATGAVDALAILRGDQRVDLLFTDVVLPGLSGKTLADAASQARPDLKILFTTGYSRDAIMHHGRLDPGVRLIGKPFTFQQLAVSVRGLLQP